jgi:hypothetical protein
MIDSIRQASAISVPGKSGEGRSVISVAARREPADFLQVIFELMRAMNEAPKGKDGADYVGLGLRKFLARGE